MKRRTMVHDQKSLFIAMNKLVKSPSSIYDYMLSFNQSANNYTSLHVEFQPISKQRNK
jgi:hypothetical protein